MTYAPIIDIPKGDEVKRITMAECDTLLEAAKLRAKYIETKLGFMPIFNRDAKRVS